jgi:hypothetical protein
MRSMTHLVAAPFLCLVCALLSVGCGGPTDPLPERQDATPEELLVTEPIDFTPTNYEPALNGPNTIAELRGLIDANAFVWHGFSPDDPYPVTGDCEPERNNVQMTTEVSGLPMTIRGVVTLYPRYFVKPSICGSDERYYGTFFIQDGSGGMMVLRDSRTAGFTFGDVVELRVKGLMKFFDYDAILSFDSLRVVTDEYVSVDDANGKKDIYVQEITRPFAGTDQGSVMRVTGVITQEATNNNFNEMRLTSPDGSVIWIISLDREIGQRNPDWKLGDTLEVTGPVLNSFGLKIIVMSYGQVNKLSSAMGGN